jgi:hypothetical protein
MILQGPAETGAWQRPSPLVILLATLGGALLLVVAVTSWPAYGDEHAYWTAAQRLIAGQAVYDPSAPANTPYAYWYPPVMAQVLAPFTLFLPDAAFTFLWTVLLVVCVWVLAGRDPLIALACVAFVPVALELRVRNVHLLIALLVVLGLRRSWAFWIPAAAMKLAPALGVVYLLANGRRREAGLVVLVGGAVAAGSYLISPEAWADWAGIAGGRASSDVGSWVPIAYPIRLAAGAVLAGVAGRRGGRSGEAWLVVAITLASPTLWANALSQLLAVVPLLRGRGASSATGP